MLTLKNYQEKAVNELLANTYRLLKKPSARHKLVFKAPTGAGKTVTMASLLNRLSEELPDRNDLPQRDIAYIWIAPNTLHLQSFGALKHFFSELRSIKPIQFEEITDGRLKPNELLFLNWQSVNSANNVKIRENESGRTLLSYIEQARLKDTTVVMIVDEEHLYAKGKRAKELLQEIYAKIEIRVSATPFTKSDYNHTVLREDVVEEQMIKKGVLLNPDIDASAQQGRDVDSILLERALQKREQIAQAYQELGININPLLLIQLPSDNKQESALDKQKIELVEQYLNVHHNINTQNEKLAVWLSNKKENLEGLEEFSSHTDVLLFKQAISLGWDCPRAAVLVIFRDIKQEAFGIQTVGRILRMPEQRHYPNALLNQGYVYTNLSSDFIAIEPESADYITTLVSKRIEDYQPIRLESSHINKRIVRNRLGSTFRRSFYEVAEREWGVHQEGMANEYYAHNLTCLKRQMLEVDVSRIDIKIPKDMHLKMEVGIQEVGEQERFAKTTQELAAMFRQFCRSNVGSFAKVDSTPILEGVLKTFIEDYLGIDEFNGIKLVLHPPNQGKWIDLIEKALEHYRKVQEKKAANMSKTVSTYTWEVPAERQYNGELYEVQEAETHVLDPCLLYTKRSKPEQEFAAFLESYRQYLQWWYKNGESNKEDFSIAYEDHREEKRTFFVDFVIQFKEGTLALFDTKTPDSEADFCQKHNALIAYIEGMRQKGRKVVGGVIVPKYNNQQAVWKYSENRISDSRDTTGWTTFFPDKYQ